MQSFAAVSNLLWVIGGDFNNLLFESEKDGGRPYPRWLLKGFGNAIQDCGLKDLKLIGCQYTWEKYKESEGRIRERLDRVMANEA